MKLKYYSDTDSLYIELSPNPSADSHEISSGIVLDYDANNNIVGIDIDHASQKIDMSEITIDKLPIHIEKLTA